MYSIEREDAIVIITILDLSLIAMLITKLK